MPRLPSSSNWWAAPPKVEIDHNPDRPLGPVPRLARMCVPSGNHRMQYVCICCSSGKARVSPVLTTLRNKPVLSLNANYLPSGESAALQIGSFCRFPVSR